jgi:hypothetical protein
MQRSPEARTLAKRRLLKINKSFEIKTPLLLPSFSSKGFPNVQKTLRTMEEFISDEVLISAYDVHYGQLKPPFDFASSIFVDSGGYEASKDTELSETFDKAHLAQEWTPELHAGVLSNWESLSPTVFVSFDHPKYRSSTEDQIARARDLAVPDGHARELLIKPETT